ncbi:hypothetical protein HG536_0E04200 [Torulaspora globosa]|uniref:FAS1 domain-containing protein n=1 Tax=Torulaspora globosa TaxID=48254 RepID=A0A7G3ZJ23_9SACH|nr:uncharacterized protein HG536_0E04200 [Torulaspora globosa]QLL33509.1 hypothetical protein HG536_0E04200 [Torulaspora globosa]
MKGLPYAIAGLLSCVATVQCLGEPCKDCDFTSVVDILSASAMFSTFLRVLQRNGDIPTLNELQNFTLLAPVNTAFAGLSDSESIAGFDISNYILRDRVLETSAIDNGTSVIYEGVKFPLGLRRDESGPIRINGAAVVESDLKPNFQNATVHGISELLPDPPNSRGLVHDINREGRSVNIFHSFVESFPGFEQMTDNNTLLIPSDVNFFKCFNHIEINYILDTFDELSSLDGPLAGSWSHDRQIFLQNLICHGIIGGQTANRQIVKNLNNQPVQVTSHELGSSLSVNDSTPSNQANMIFDRGIAHSFSDLPFLPDAFQFTAEKYLHGMNSTDFVKELYFRKLQHMIREKSLHQNLTIFVPEFNSNEHQGFTKSSLLYHFVEYQLWLEEEFKDVNRIHSSTKTFPSAFCSSNKRLGGNCQRLRITKTESSYIINDKYRVLHAKPYMVGRTLVYTISEALQLPGEFLFSLNPFHHCSKSLSLLRQVNLLNLPLNNKGYTILLPCFDSWRNYDLNFEYLRNNATAVEHIAKSMILQSLIYSDTKTQTIEVSNMLDEEVSLSIHPPRSNRVDIELSNVVGKIKIERGLDALFNQGVIHPLKGFYLPKDINISLKDLIETSGANRFLELLENLEDFTSMINESIPFSVLVPMSTFLGPGGITGSSKNLQDFLKVHLAIGSSTHSLLKCDGTISTLFGEPLICRQSSTGDYWLKLQNGDDHEVRILRRGCASSGNESCVFLIDRPISIRWLNRDKKSLRLPGIAIGAGVLVGSVSMLAVFLCILLVLFGKSAKRSPLPASADEEHTNQEARPLLANNDSSRAISNLSHEQNGRFESTYSSNASVPAIDVAYSPR